jgi:peptidyl-prolyl cis-trans isomerase SurA
MKLVLIFFLLIFAKICIGNIDSNEIIAIVNQKIITPQSIQPQLNQSNSLTEKIELINSRIDLILKLELVEKFNLNPSRDQIKQALEHISNKNNISLIELKKNLNFNLIENDVKKNLSIFNLKSFLTKDLSIYISENEIKNLCHNNAQNIKQIKIAEIVISQPPSYNPKNGSLESSSKNFLKKLSNHINKGASFFNLAKLHSQDSSYFNGGISEWKTINSKILKEIDLLKDNEVSSVYTKKNGWAVAIKLDQRFINLEFEDCKKDIRKVKAEK